MTSALITNFSLTSSNAACVTDVRMRNASANHQTMQYANSNQISENIKLLHPEHLKFLNFTEC